MIDPLAQTQIELGALRAAFKNLLGKIARMNTSDAAGATQWVEDFQKSTLAGIEGWNINVQSGGVTVEEARTVMRNAVVEATGGITLSDS